jgi:hypothetical protein
MIFSASELPQDWVDFNSWTQRSAADIVSHVDGGDTNGKPTGLRRDDIVLIANAKIPTHLAFDAQCHIPAISDHISRHKCIKRNPNTRGTGLDIVARD